MQMMIMENNITINNNDYSGDFDLELTLYSGQTSQPPWKKIENEYYEVLSFDKEDVLVKISQNKLNDPLNITYYSNNISSQKIKERICYIFDLNYPINELYKYLEENEELNDVYGFNRGLRLYKAQNPYECIISSICSANNSIKRWTKSVNDIRQLAGQEYSRDDEVFYTFPKEEDFLKLSEDELKSCGVGYRSTYMLNSTREILNNPNYHQNIDSLSYRQAFDEILKLEGVGPKVADCILLYGYNKHEAYPVDVWINRITTYLYFKNQKVSNKKIMDFAQEKFGKYSGYVQLYLFNYARLSGLMDELKQMHKKK